MAIADAALRAILDRYRRSQLATGASTAALVLELGREWSAGRLSREELEVALIAAEKLGFSASSGVAATHLAEIRAAQDASGITEMADFDLRAAMARAEATVAALDRVPDRPDIHSQILGKAAVWADRSAKMGGRRTIERSAAASGRRWRRVPDGDPCAFCAMLATRGYLDDGYTSRESALWTAAGRTYHDFCGCVATEIVDDWVPTPQEQRWIDAYETAGAEASAQGLPLTPETVLPRMRAQAGAFNDSPRPAAEPEPDRWLDLADDKLEALMEQAMADGDFAKAERLGEILDTPRLPSGSRIDYQDAMRPEVYEWFETASQADQDRLLGSLSQLDADNFGRAQWEHMSGKQSRQAPSKREQREQYETYLETEYLAAESVTNGHMLSPEARAAGRTSRDLWSVNESTARSWASPEMLEYWDAHGRMTWSDWQAMNGGDMGDIQKKRGTWLA